MAGAFVGLPLAGVSRAQRYAVRSQRPFARPVPRRATVQASAKVEKIGGERLEKELQEAELPLVVDFYATWCGPCQFMVPELEKIATKYDGRVTVFKIDSEEEPDLATLLQVRALPTLFFIKGNELRFRFEGALMEDQLTEVIEQVFFGAAPSPEAVAEAAAAEAKVEGEN